MPHPFGSDIEERRRILSYLGDQTLPRILGLTTPLFTPGGDGQPVLVASGLVIQVGASRLLVTASHVFTEWPGVGIVARDSLSAVYGERTTLHTDNATPGTPNDKADVTIVRLAPELAQQVPQSEILELSDIDWGVPAVGRDPFLLVGYPERRNRRGFEGETFTARAYPLLVHDAEEEMYVAVGADPQASLVCPFDPRDVWTVDSQVTAPNLQGVSGGGLWRVPINDQPVRSTRLTAIAIEQHTKGRHRHILATRIRPVLCAIYEKQPDLRGVLEQGCE